MELFKHAKYPCQVIYDVTMNKNWQTGEETSIAWEKMLLLNWLIDFLFSTESEKKYCVTVFNSINWHSANTVTVLFERSNFMIARFCVFSFSYIIIAHAYSLKQSKLKWWHSWNLQMKYILLFAFVQSVITNIEIQGREGMLLLNFSLFYYGWLTQTKVMIILAS